MYCSNCGAKLADNAKFCTECGAKIDAPVQQPAVPSPSERQTVSAAGTPAPQPAQGGDPKQGYVPPAGQNPYPYAGRPSCAQGQPKKRRTGLIAVLVLLALIPLTVILLVVALRLRHEEPPLPPLTEPAVTETVSGEEAVPTSSETPAETDPTEPAPAAEPTSAADAALSDAQAAKALDKLTGYWNTADDTQFVSVTKMEGGLYYLTAGYWYSEAHLMGYLRAPVKGDPDGEITLTLYFEGIDSEEYDFPPLNDPISFDLSQIADGRLTWSFGGDSETVTYAGASMEEAIPPL